MTVRLWTGVIFTGLFLAMFVGNLALRACTWNGEMHGNSHGLGADQ